MAVSIFTNTCLQIISGTCQKEKWLRKQDLELKLTFNYRDKIYKLFYIRGGSTPSIGIIKHCKSNKMEIAFINSKKMVDDISDILKNNQAICPIAVGGYLTKQSSKARITASEINWESMMKDREMHTNCLVLSDYDPKTRQYGGPVYTVFAWLRYCHQEISQFLCERDRARNNTNASITTTSLFTSDHNASPGQNYTAISPHQNYRTISLGQNYTTISVWPSLTDVKSTMVKGKAMAS